MKVKLTEAKVNNLSEEQIKTLRLTEEQSRGSWFLFPNYIVIHLYRFDKRPFQLPKYVSPLFFSYEVLRQKMIVNELHFVSKKKGSLFSYLNVISPLIAKNKNAIDALEKEIFSFGFLQDDLWHYDPMGIIPSLKTQAQLSAYIHEKIPEVEKLANITTLVSDTVRSTTSIGMTETATQIGSRNYEIQILDWDADLAISFPATPTSKRKSKALIPSEVLW